MVIIAIGVLKSNAIGMIELSLLKDHSCIFFNTLNEYSIVIARLALKHTTQKFIFSIPLQKYFQLASKPQDYSSKYNLF